jgi:hypothetical protein
MRSVEIADTLMYAERDILKEFRVENANSPDRNGHSLNIMLLLFMNARILATMGGEWKIS